MKISLVKEELITKVKTDLLVVGVQSKKIAKDPLVAKLNSATRGVLLRCIKDEEFTGKKGQTLAVLAQGSISAKYLLLVGLWSDKKESAESVSRWLGVFAGREAQKHASIALVAPSQKDDVLRSIAEGITTGAYRYTRYFTGSRKPKQRLRKATIVVQQEPTKAAQKTVDDGARVGTLVNLARDLVNCPANHLSPADLAEIAAEECKKAGISCKIYNKNAIEKLGMPLLLAVNQGSSREPRFVHMVYKPITTDKTTPRVVFVGKGLTFDSGGLCLKPPTSMLDMKEDMSGAAVTLGIVLAAAHLKLPVEVHGLIAATDNSIGPDAYRPGDVLPSRNGKFVEVINTDAEGRMVLADALTYAGELKPTYMVDHATLTGSCEVALGSYTCGLFCNNDQLARLYLQASKETGESYWRLPLASDLKDQLKSAIADLKHTGSRYGGAITAALFLQEFVGNRRWVHLDIAGPAFLERQHGTMPKGGTGFGVITGVRFLESVASTAKKDAE
ncbi:MAG: leucyl aminopeptidase [Deltaproteobacteria bacterium]|nr:leucyl aminopeptidase [Deltaproteobacteria bacterium]